MPGPPQALNTDQGFYAHHSEQLMSIAQLLAEQTALLGEIRDRLTAPEPAPPAEPEPGPVAVELREPAALGKSDKSDTPTAPSEDKKPTRTARGGRRTTKAGT